MVDYILVVTPGIGFGEMFTKILQDVGDFTVYTATTRSAAVSLAHQYPFSLAILDSDLRGFSLHELGEDLIAVHPDIHLVVIPPAENQDLFPLVGFVPDGFLSKPFYPPNLVSHLQHILSQPLARRQPVLITSWANQSFEVDAAQENHEPEIQPAPGAAAVVSSLNLPSLQDCPVVQAAPSPPTDELSGPDWLQDPAWAARYLTRLTLETSAQAALLTRGGSLWAYAGQLPQEAAQEVAGMVARQPGSVGSDVKSGDLAGYTRFTRLESTQEECMLYITHLSQVMALALVFDANIPFSKIRQEASSLAGSLSRPVPVLEMAQPAMPPQPLTKRLEPAALAGPTPSGEEPEPVDLPPMVVRANFLPPELVPPPTPTYPSGSRPLRPFELPNVPAARVSEPSPVEIPPAEKPAPAPAAEATSHLLQPLLIPPEELPEPLDVLRLPSVVYHLQYAYVLVPRMPEHTLTRQVARQLSAWLQRLSLSFGWDLMHLAVRPEYVSWISSVTPEVSPGQVVATIRRFTSAWLYEQYPVLTRQNPSGDFWAPGYLVIATHLPLPGRVLREFVRARRRRLAPFEPH